MRLTHDGRWSAACAILAPLRVITAGAARVYYLQAEDPYPTFDTTVPDHLAPEGKPWQLLPRIHKS
jgi:hypothetical protein